MNTAVRPKYSPTIPSKLNNFVLRDAMYIISSIPALELAFFASDQQVFINCN